MGFAKCTYIFLNLPFSVPVLIVTVGMLVQSDALDT
jgi:hypothetical protein